MTRLRRLDRQMAWKIAEHVSTVYSTCDATTPVYLLFVRKQKKVYGALLERSICPQNLVVHLTLCATNGALKPEAHGMTASPSLAHFDFANKEKDRCPRTAGSSSVGANGGFHMGLQNIRPGYIGILLGQMRAAKMGQEIDVWSCQDRGAHRANTAHPQHLQEAHPCTCKCRMRARPLVHCARLLTRLQSTSKILRVLPASIHNRGISVANSAYISPCPKLPAFTSSDAPAFTGRAIGVGTYLYRATLHPLGDPLDPSRNASGKDSAPAAPEAKVLTTKNPLLPLR
ncbi:hypothetical protein FIBSPDRAFT_937352 [Athelia psychrophila]|uniref:Uncharacterized protein n=1 Tax=Athelia psychrophila TaxID=1759441 RepID=A0A166AM80_9AGAM|nr:hypothetical protein FIBSPDRAFT_937352 [Fibularhizoctonia sp. CBS 109695]